MRKANLLTPNAVHQARKNVVEKIEFQTLGMSHTRPQPCFLQGIGLFDGCQCVANGSFGNA